jgi:hypothetical protein
MNISSMQEGQHEISGDLNSIVEIRYQQLIGFIKLPFISAKAWITFPDKRNHPIQLVC